MAGRTRVETEGLIGFFVNTLVLRTNLEGDPSFTEVLQRVRETTVGAFDHQEVPFERVIEALHPERRSHQAPYLQIVFALEDLQDEMRLAGLTAEALEVDTSTSKFDLTWVVRQGQRGLSVGVEYDTSQVENAIARLVQHWQTLLEGIVAHPERVISKLPLLTTAERQQILSFAHPGPRTYPQDSTITAVFSDQVQAHPKALAVRYGSDELTYQQLDERANVLAHHLRVLDVRPGTNVGLMAEPSIDLVVGMLGILKAGGRTFPLIPPTQRLGSGSCWKIPPRSWWSRKSIYAMFCRRPMPRPFASNH